MVTCETEMMTRKFQEAATFLFFFATFTCNTVSLCVKFMENGASSVSLSLHTAHTRFTAALQHPGVGPQHPTPHSHPPPPTTHTH